jgi:hypothetical protein
MSKNFTNCTLSYSSRHYRQWASCLFRSFFEFWTVHVLSTTFEKNRRSSFTRRSRNSSLSAI